MLLPLRTPSREASSGDVPLPRRCHRQVMRWKDPDG